mgnify:CR=1 FL=1|tara:strand:- start:132927 stop:133571 length:645 start_codon:yes stop_codon:yes gene_type:complete
MRNTLFIAFGLFFAFSSSAQIIKKDLLFVSANTSFSVNSGKTLSEIDNGATSERKEISNVLSLDLSPKAGIMLTDNLGAGLSVLYNYTRETFINRDDSTGIKIDENKVNASSIVAGPFLRYYLQNGERSGMYINAEILAGSNNIKSDASESSVGIFQFNAGLGGQYFVNENIALEGNLNYFQRSSTFDGKTDMVSGINFNAGFTVFLNGGAFSK